MVAGEVMEASALGKKLFLSLFAGVSTVLNLLPDGRETKPEWVATLMMLLDLLHKRLA